MRSVISGFLGGITGRCPKNNFFLNNDSSVDVQLIPSWEDNRATLYWVAPIPVRFWEREWLFLVERDLQLMASNKSRVFIENW